MNRMKRLFLTLLVLGFASGSLSACSETPGGSSTDNSDNGTTTTGGKTGDECSGTKACADGYVCSAKLDSSGNQTGKGVCTKTCATSATCPTELPSCVKGKSLAGAPQQVCGFCEQTHVKCAADADACIVNSDSKGVCTATCQGVPECTGTDKCLPNPAAKVLDAAANGGSKTCQVDNTPTIEKIIPLKAAKKGEPCSDALACEGTLKCVLQQMHSTWKFSSLGICEERAACDPTDRNACASSGDDCVEVVTSDGVETFCGTCGGDNGECAGDGFKQICLRSSTAGEKASCVDACTGNSDCAAAGLVCKEGPYRMVVGIPFTQICKTDTEGPGGYGDVTGAISKPCDDGLFYAIMDKSRTDGWCTMKCTENSQCSPSGAICGSMLTRETATDTPEERKVCVPATYARDEDRQKIGEECDFVQMCQLDSVCMATNPANLSKGTCVKICTGPLDCKAIAGKPNCVEHKESEFIVSNLHSAVKICEK